ncbi:MAG TPA: hypothetical protein VFG89_08875 [Coriobacteriia bacterium]|nr:hypothetical protein [Coriobacteriia bacterium]
MHRALRATLLTAVAVAALIAVPLTARAYVSGDGTDDIADVRTAVPVTDTSLSNTLASWVDSDHDGVPDAGTDTDDVYLLRLKAGEWLYASMTAGDTDFDMFLFSSEATSVAGSTPAVAWSETKATSDERFFFQAQTTGDYFLNLYAFDGKGRYTVTLGKPSADQPTMTATAPTPIVAWGGSGKVTGVLSNSTGALAGRQVALYGKKSGVGASYKRLAVASTDATGTYNFTVKPTAVMTYDVRFEGDAAYLPTANVPDVKVRPYAYLTAPTVPKTVKKNKTFTSTGYLRPKHSTGAYSVSVKCYLKNSAGVYKWVKTVKARNVYYNSSKTTKYSAKIKLPKKGKWKLVAYVPGGNDHAATYSAARYKTAK